jgi:hypothetical protein
MRPCTSRYIFRLIRVTFMTSDHTDDLRFRLKAALNGFASAFKRLQPVTGPSATAERIFIAWSEVLWWAVSVDDGFEDLARNDQSYRPNLGDYRAARNSDSEGQILRALRYARDRCGHQRALVTSSWGPALLACLDEDDELPVSWRKSADLPPPDPRFDSETLRAEYDRLLAGWPADEALWMVKIWFEREQARARL